MSEPNPLLQIQFPVPFDRIKAEHVEPAVKELLASARTRLEALGSDSLPQPLTFDASLMALDSLTDGLDYAMGVVRHLESVATYPELRAAYNAAQPEVSAFYTGIPLHAGVWNTVKSYAATAEARELTGHPQALPHQDRRQFPPPRRGTRRRAGKKRLEEIDVELTKLTTKFSENVLDSTNAFELVLTDEKQLAGLPPSAIDAARQSAAQESSRAGASHCRARAISR